MFEPGHLHFARQPCNAKETEFSLDLYYEIRNDAKEGTMVHFRLEADVAGKAFEEAFDLHRDTAFNFASHVSRIMARHGLPPANGPVLSNHRDYDAMFEDIRNRLNAHSGDAMNLDHLETDRILGPIR